MVRAWQEGAETILPDHIIPNPKGIAKAILRGDPGRVYTHMRAIVKESGGTFVSASETEIREARQLALDLEGIDICFSAATAVASVIKQTRRNAINKDAIILVNLTGSDRPEKDIPDDVIHLYKNQGKWNKKV